LEIAMKNPPTIDGKTGQSNSDRDRLVADLEALRLKHNLAGCVLIAFDPRAANVSATAAGRTIGFYTHMKTLGDHILARIEDRELEPKVLATA
jgi:hypothetical protein